MEKRNLLFEIGTEEIPAHALVKATQQATKLMKSSLKSAGLGFDNVTTVSTPRRIAVRVIGLAEATQPVNRTNRGPSAKIAFDAEGIPSRAAAGFARGQGVAPEDLIVKETPDGTYVYAEVNIPAVKTVSLLTEILENLMSDLSWPKTQKWGCETARFVRPIRWIVALFGQEVVDCGFADVRSGRTTRGHRLLAPGDFILESADAYDEVMREAFVIVDGEERSRIIREGIEAIQAADNVEVRTPAKVYEEVVNLCEYPTVMLAHFDDSFLEVPSEIITDSMIANQRYFPIYDHDGVLTNAFVLVSNGNPEFTENIVDGNERVVRARLADAAFFYHEDLAKPLEAYVELLDRVVFQEDLGTVGQKTNRMEDLASFVAAQCGTSESKIALSRRAAYLAKADLVTGAVIEFTSQQGVMGGYYAAAAGENEQVVQAVAQHYRPRFAGDALPDGFVGKMVALADKMDTICGIFAINAAPTGSSDPFAVRRATIGVIIIARCLESINLDEIIDQSLGLYQTQGLEFDETVVSDQIQGFFAARLVAIAKDEGISPDTVAAVRSVGIIDPIEYFARLNALESARKNEPDLFEDLATAYARANNLRDPELGTEIDILKLTDPELALLEAIRDTSGKVDLYLKNAKYDDAVAALAGLRAPIDRFFDEVMVMDENMDLRTNRLRLLNQFVHTFVNVADISELAKRK